MPLCEKCSYIQLPHQAPVSKNGWVRVPHTCLIRHHKTFEDLFAAAESGCDVCQYFRPFVEYAKTRRTHPKERSESDCSSSNSIGWSHSDPFQSIDRGRSTSSGAIVLSDQGRKMPTYYIGPGQYYELDSNGEEYNYLEDDMHWNARRINEKDKLIEADAAAEKVEYRASLAKLGMDPGSESDSCFVGGGDVDTTSGSGASNLVEKIDGIGLTSDQGPEQEHEQELEQGLEQGLSEENREEDPDDQDYDALYSDRMRSTRADGYAGLQWALSNTDRVTGRDQLWMTMHLANDDPDLEGAKPNRTCILTLSAGSIDSERLEDFPTMCINGVEGYSWHSVVRLYPSLWRYRIDNLVLPQKRPYHNRRPVLEVYQRRDELFPTEPVIHARDVEEDPKSPEVLHLARTWYQHCADHHQQCRLSGLVAKPSRLVDVGDGIQSQAVKLHLCRSEDNGPLKYATLSHCWGSDTDAITKLTKANLEDMVHGIELSSLSPNFHDAITVTRGLGLRYIWIDALCIIQDSKEDWVAEAANMGDYYRGSELTFSAFSSPGAKQGVLGRRKIAQQPPSIRVEGGTLYLRPLLPDAATVTDIISTSSLRPSIAVQPINARAWTLQERLFSRRLLYATQEQLVWQCRCQLASEDGQYSIDTKGATMREDSDIIDIINRKQQFIAKDKPLAPPTVHSTQWYALVAAFMQRRVTYQSDRLPALAGLAREVHRLTNTPYRAGIWLGKASLKEGLLWKPSSGRYGAKPRKPSRAENSCPSWTWASLDAEVQHDLVDETIIPKPALDPKLEAVNITLATTDPFGDVKSGRLVFEAWIHSYAGVRTLSEELLKDAETYDWAQEDWDIRTDIPNSPSADPFVDFDLEMPDDLYTSRASEPGGFRTFAIMFMCYVNEFEYEKFEGNDDATTSHRQQHFLVLEQGTRQRGLKGFQRAGVAHTNGGTVFQIDEAHGWKRERICVY